jgi:hypothetical protein
VEVLVVATLVLDILLDDIFVAVLSDGLDVVAARPKCPSPQELFDLWLSREDLSRGDALDNLDHAAGEHHGNGLDEEVDVVIIRTNLHEADFMALLDFPTDILERLLHCRSEDLLAVLRGTHQVVEHQVHIMLLMDVFAHIEEPTPSAWRPPAASCGVYLLGELNL